ncbi:MAG: LrgB family protein, partial [Gammaproteobacteria bacterium]
MSTWLAGSTWLLATVLVYALFRSLHLRLGRPAWLLPVLPTLGVLITLLVVLGVEFEAYALGTWPLHFLLGPATVAIAVPLYSASARLVPVLWPALGALLVGGLVGVGSAVGLAWLLGLGGETLLSLAPRAVTTPIAIGISERIGGVPALTAVVVIVSGVLGAVVAPPLLRVLGIQDPRVQGLAIGVAAHGVGTAQAFELSPEAGAFAGLA